MSDLPLKYNDHDKDYTPATSEQKKRRSWRKEYHRCIKKGFISEGVDAMMRGVRNGEGWAVELLFNRCFGRILTEEEVSSLTQPGITFQIVQATPPTIEGQVKDVTEPNKDADVPPETGSVPKEQQPPPTV